MRNNISFDDIYIANSLAQTHSMEDLLYFIKNGKFKHMPDEIDKISISATKIQVQLAIDNYYLPKNKIPRCDTLASNLVQIKLDELKENNHGEYAKHNNSETRKKLYITYRDIFYKDESESKWDEMLKKPILDN